MYALDSGGAVQCWGRNDFGQVRSAPSGLFSSISISSGHVCGVTVTGLVTCCGRDQEGQVSNVP